MPTIARHAVNTPAARRLRALGGVGMRALKASSGLLSFLFSSVILSVAIGFLSLTAAPTLHAETFVVDSTTALDDALIEAFDGDEIVLKPGHYQLQPVIESAIVMRGEGNADDIVIEGPGKGAVVTVRVPGVRLENFTVKGYGSDLYAKDAGVRVMDGADGIVIRGLVIEGPGFGVRADRLEGLVLEGTSITGDAKMHVLDRGDGVFLNYVKRPKLTENRVRNVRDGFYFENVEESYCEGNFFTGAQYGIHWMYTRGDFATKNRAAGVRGGYALMSSRGVTLKDSETSGNIEFGVLVNVCESCVVDGNRIRDVHNPKGNPALDTEGKGIHIYGPGTSKIHGNQVLHSDIGIGVAMGGEGNVLWENAFIDNGIQVRYVGETPLEWSFEGRGNFWSTHMTWDVDHDGIADTPYQPNDSLDRIFWIYPEARFLMESPVVALLRWLADQFEIDRGKGVTDSHPLASWEVR